MRYLERVDEYVIEITENGTTWSQFARRFDDYWQAENYGIEIQVQTQRLLQCRVVPVSLYILRGPQPATQPATQPEEIDHFEELKDFAETHPGVSIPRPQMNEGDTVEDTEITVTLDGPSCDDEGCPHYLTPHEHVTKLSTILDRSVEVEETPDADGSTTEREGVFAQKLKERFDEIF